MEPAGCDSRRTIAAVACRHLAEPIHGHLMKGEEGLERRGLIMIRSLIPMHLTVEPASIKTWQMYHVVLRPLQIETEGTFS